MGFRYTVESGTEGKRTRKALGRFPEDPKGGTLKEWDLLGWLA